MMRLDLSPLAVLAVACVVGGAALAKPPAPASATSPRFTGHRFAADARVSLGEARRLALKARPGVITDEELEKEAGGSGLRYSFDVKSGGVTFEVGVDAKSGDILENDREGDHPD
ncbi:MAG TPA: PepSY domain-containing protein [Caulobacteraceae bacterium]|jgi:uncharacterized membrane protein YkoI|nr:PepSY domain-containing protein [Caulobacteraceae bacterium]